MASVCKHKISLGKISVLKSPRVSTMAILALGFLGSERRPLGTAVTPAGG